MKQPFKCIAPLVLAAAVVSPPALAAQAGGGGVQEHAVTAAHELEPTLFSVVREATGPFRHLEAAEAAGYGLLHGCVSGPGGAMGVHYANGDLVGDPALDATRPEVLMYEWRNGQPRLVGAEFVVIAEAWDAANPAPPVLGGQLFSYTGAPNRYGIPAFYSLHVWAWKHNPAGVFADWNPNVICSQYTGDDDAAGQGH
jgi:hypothetical protein